VPSESVSLFLFGRFQASHDGRPIAGLDSRKAQELFCYRLLHRERPHHRDLLADPLWRDSLGTQSRKYLRQALWQLRNSFETLLPACDEDLLQLDHDWMELSANPRIWVDATVFEHAFWCAEETAGEQLEAPQADALRNAVGLYGGDLLEGWYVDLFGHQLAQHPARHRR
jgi:DNA-binding SARP family transcriptional activator